MPDRYYRSKSGRFFDGDHPDKPLTDDDVLALLNQPPGISREDAERLRELISNYENHAEKQVCSGVGRSHPWDLIRFCNSLTEPVLSKREEGEE